MEDAPQQAPPPRENMKIWQQNLCKLNSAWEHLLRNLDPGAYDIACIQEPFLNLVNLVNALNLQ
jgi:hypothetical protein